MAFYNACLPCTLLLEMCSAEEKHAVITLNTLCRSKVCTLTNKAFFSTGQNKAVLCSCTQFINGLLTQHQRYDACTLLHWPEQNGAEC